MDFLNEEYSASELVAEVGRGILFLVMIGVVGFLLLWWAGV